MTGTEGGRVSVFTAGESRTLFLGLRVRRATRAEQVRPGARREAMVVDGDGHRVDVDGALYDGERAWVQATTEDRNPV